MEQPATMQGKNLDSPDETRESENVKPIAGTDSCQVPHVEYVVSGRMRVRMDDGTEHEFGPGGAGTIPPGHDA